MFFMDQIPYIFQDLNYIDNIDDVTFDIKVNEFINYEKDNIATYFYHIHIDISNWEHVAYSTSYIIDEIEIAEYIEQVLIQQHINIDELNVIDIETGCKSFINCADCTFNGCQWCNSDPSAIKCIAYDEFLYSDNWCNNNYNEMYVHEQTCPNTCIDTLWFKSSLSCSKYSCQCISSLSIYILLIIFFLIFIDYDFY